MINIEDIIRDEPECSFVEFKAEQYFEKGFPAFVRDMMAMANSSYEGAKYIIIGVKEKDGNKTLEGMFKPLQDAAHYDQVIHANIEPEIPFSSRMVQLDGRSYGVFTIKKCPDKPYMMKKDLQELRKGEFYIRKGTAVGLLIRRDLDAIWEHKSKVARFDGDVQVTYRVDSKPSDAVPIQRLVILPSEREAAIIDRMLRNSDLSEPYGAMLGVELRSWKYDAMSVEELKDQLKRVKDTFIDEDLYEKFERLGAKVNFTLMNTGSMYIEDVTVDISVPALPGLEIAPRQYYQGGAVTAAAFHTTSLMNPQRQYPNVKLDGGIFEIRQRFGDLRHGMLTNLFGTPIRVFADHRMAGQRVQTKMTIHGKNLAKALELEVPIQFGQ